MTDAKGKRGGARPGAGRKPKDKAAPDEPTPQGNKSMLELLQDVALGRTTATALQVRAAIAAVQYTHTKRGEGGKKESQADAAKEAGSGKFGAGSGPRLVHSK